MVFKVKVLRKWIAKINILTELWNQIYNAPELRMCWDWLKTMSYKINVENGLLCSASDSRCLLNPRPRTCHLSTLWHVRVHVCTCISVRACVWLASERPGRERCVHWPHNGMAFAGQEIWQDSKDRHLLDISPQYQRCRNANISFRTLIYVIKYSQGKEFFLTVWLMSSHCFSVGQNVSAVSATDPSTYASWQWFESGPLPFACLKPIFPAFVLACTVTSHPVV